MCQCNGKARRIGQTDEGLLVWRCLDCYSVFYGNDFECHIAMATPADPAVNALLALGGQQERS